MFASARHFAAILLSLSLSSLFAAETPAADSIKTFDSVLMRRGDIVTLVLRHELDPRTAQEGSIVLLEVYQSVVVDGETIVAVGAHAEGSLVFVKKPGRLGSPGALALQADNIMTTDGQRVPLRHLDRLLAKSTGKMAIGTIIKAEVAYDVVVNSSGRN